MTRLRLRTTIASGLTLAAALCGCSETTPMEVELLEAEAGSERPATSDRRTPGPATRSGELGQEDLPAPSALGERWAYRVDEGDPEEGYRGSGKPAIAREPRSVVEAITPLGCRPQPLPVPRHALEVTYARGRLPGVGLALQFADESEARRFFSVHADVLEICSTARRVEVEVLSRMPETLLSVRSEQLGATPTWVEGARLAGDRVILIAVADGSAQEVGAVEAALDTLVAD